MDRWPHQITGVHGVIDAIDRGVRRICLTSPTGGGKTFMIEDIVRKFLAINRRVALYTNRRLLLDQVIGDFTEARIPFGIRAAGYESDLGEPFQVCILQTAVSRCLKRGTWNVHAAGPGDLAIFDEGHLHTTGKTLDLRKRHHAGGAATLDVTATPLGMGGVCDELVVAGSMSQLRQCGALLLADYYGPDEPDLRAARSKTGKPPPEGEDLSEQQQRAVMGKIVDGEANTMLRALHGRISTHFARLNPDRKPSILFAPGVGESIWCAEQLTRIGIRAAHIDGEHIWLDGELHRKTDALWQEVLDESRTGRIVVLCNTFVLREGINAPWLAHGILATVFGSVVSYLQSVGRLLRADRSLDKVTIQDHGGNYLRHGSPNVDRVWSLDDTAASVYLARADRIREKRERPPVACPACSRVMSRRVCVCGFEFPLNKVARAVATTDGKLIQVTTDFFPERRKSRSDPTAIGAWIITWKRACSVKWYATFRQAEADYARNNRGFYPDRTWPLFPIDIDRDIGRRVLDVPADRLRGDPNLLADMRAHQDRQLAKLRTQNGTTEEISYAT